MNAQYIYDRTNDPKFEEASDAESNSQVKKAELLDDNYLADADLENQNPEDETLVMIDEINEPVTDEITFISPPVLDIKMEGSEEEYRTTLETNPKEPQEWEKKVEETVDSDLIPDDSSTIGLITPTAPIDNNSLSSVSLLESDEIGKLRTRWNEIQGKFVDEPRSAVQEADALVSEVVEQITGMFTSERSTLEVQWKQGGDVSTEDLRTTLQHYRSFFNRLMG